jgi:hypothetical protein
VKESEAAKLLAMLITAFPDEWRFLSDEQQRDTRALYARMMIDLDYARADAAVVRLIATARKMPKVSELRAMVSKLSRGREHNGGEAWGVVRRLIGRYGYMRTPGADFEISDPLIARCVEAFGWRTLCDGGYQAADRARFVDLYDRLAAEQGEDLAVGRIAAPIPARQLGAGPTSIADILGGSMLPQKALK